MRAWIVALLCLGAAVSPSLGQTETRPEALYRARTLERRGDRAAAAEIYKSLLASQRDDLTALAGLERCYRPDKRLAELVKPVEAALGVGSINPELFRYALKLYAELSNWPGAASVFDRWVAKQPDSVAPYREWAMAATFGGQLDRARAALTTGRQRFGPGALGAEMATLLVAEGDARGAATEWLAAVTKDRGLLDQAVVSLGDLPADRRSPVFDVLGTKAPAGVSLGAMLLVRWGEPRRAVRRVVEHRQALGSAIEATVRELLERLRESRAPEWARARAEAQELLGEVSGAEGSHWWMEAARGYADLGDSVAAMRVLSRVATDSSATPRMVRTAASSLIRMALARDQVEDAERLLEQSPLQGPERDDLTSQIVLGWAHRGDFERAERLARDKMESGSPALMAQIELYRGRLRSAEALFRKAGVRGNSREEVVARTSLLAMLQSIDEDSLPELGRAFWHLGRRDTSKAVASFERAAEGLPPARGGAAVLLHAGRAAVRSDRALAERMFRKVAAMKVATSSPAAELDLAKLLLQDDEKNAEAIATLEHLILTYPQSSTVAEARRLLDRAKGKQGSG